MAVDQTNPPKAKYTSSRKGDTEILLERVLERLSN
jgi:hypothetical protein